VVKLALGRGNKWCECCRLERQFVGIMQAQHGLFTLLYVLNRDGRIRDDAIFGTSFEHVIKLHN